MQHTLQEEGANAMQKLAVEIICQQLEKTWHYFTRTFKMQVIELGLQENAQKFFHSSIF